MKNYVLPLFILLVSAPALSQTIKGNLKDNEDNPLPFANILLLNSSDSTLIKGAASDESGEYLFENINYGTYLLAATMVGYIRTYSNPIILNELQKDIIAPILILSNDVKLLREVTVEITRPFIEQEIDRTIINVANSIIASGSTALEVLEKAPGVIVDRQNDALSLRGKDGVIVQIDGKQTYLAMADVVALLKSTSSDNIDKIELITNPSAKYDAAGNAGIINIIMKKNNNIGTNGSLSMAGGSGRYHREQGSLQVNHRENKLNIFGNYSINRGSNYMDLYIYRIQPEGAQYNIVTQKTYHRKNDTGQNAKTGLDYFIGRNTTLGIVWTGFWNNHQQLAPATAEFRRQELGPVYLQTSTNKTISSISSNHIANLNLQHTFGTKGGIISADIDYGRFIRDFRNTLTTATIISDDPVGLQGLLLIMPTTIDIRTYKADYSRSILGNWKMETGVKSSSVRSDNNMALSSGLVGELTPDKELSNHFQYTEQVNAMYTSISGKPWAKTNMQLGFRAEHTHSIGHSVITDQIVDLNYLDVFPNFLATSKLSEKHNLTLSYGYRIDRPNYQSLNPARGYIDPYAFSRGNPFLKPQYTHALEIKHSFDNKIFTSLGADFITDKVMYILHMIDSEKVEMTPENLGPIKAYNFNISFPVTILKGWTLQTNFMVLYSQTQIIYDGTLYNIEQLSGRLNGNNSIVLGKGWTAEISGRLNTPARFGMFYAPWFGTLDAGLQKAVGSKWKVKLNVQDLFHSIRFFQNSDLVDFKQNFKMDTRVAMLNLTYTFGNQQLKGTRQRKMGSEEEIRRTD